MNISLHIDRLVMDTSLSPAGRKAFQGALQSELTRLLSRGGVSRSFQSGAAVPEVRVDALRRTGRESPADLGVEVARTVYGGLKRPDGR